MAFLRWLSSGHQLHLKQQLVLIIIFSFLYTCIRLLTAAVNTLQDVMNNYYPVVIMKLIGEGCLITQTDLRTIRFSGKTKLFIYFCL